MAHFDQHPIYGDVMRMQTPDDVERIQVLEKVKCYANFTSVSFTLEELTRLRAGFLRAADGYPSADIDEAVYSKLVKAEARLKERL